MIIVIGANGATLGSTPMAPGSVATAISGPAYLNTVSFLAADAPNSLAAPRRPERIRLGLLRP